MPERFDRVAILGTGLMGGSLALALKEHSAVGTVAVYDISPETRRQAADLEIAAEVADSGADAVRGADLVFLATPISRLAEALGEIAGALSEGTVVTDLASAKREVVALFEERLPAGVHYVGGHPMTGSEQSGVSFARPDLFRDRYYILTPTPSTDTEAYRRLHALLTDMGARVISMDPEAHDRTVAVVSHVPHLLSLLLMENASRQRETLRNVFTVAAGGFRDMTRIAASNPDIWLDICLANRGPIIKGLLDYGVSITELVGLLEDRDTVSLRRMFERAREARVELAGKPGLDMAQLFEVFMPVPDEPGVISRITTEVGALGINIEDIAIEHPMEGETGIMTLTVLGEENAQVAAGRLQSLGYQVGVRGI
ncbi:MAG: prephenate dehydrogenase [Actinomycetota bacterium]